MTSNKRARIFVHPKFQTTFILFSLLTSLLNILIFFTSNYFFFHKFEALGIEFGIPATSTFFTFIERQKSAMNSIFIITSVISVVIIGILGLIFSHRISGPIYRLEKILANLSPEQPRSIEIRKGDFFPELVIALNSFIKK